ncbi:MAG: hypothetical protein U0264_03540 [Candidatus Kapaibacterium sp.]
MKIKLIIVLVASLAWIIPSKAQRVEIAATPLAAVWSIPENGAKYNNAYGLMLSVFKTDSSLLRIQLRYDYFEAKFDPISGLDNSFHTIGIGLSRVVLFSEPVRISAFASLGFTSAIQEPVATPVVRDSLGNFISYTSKAPSTINATLGVQGEYYVSQKLAPFVEAAIVQSIKTKEYEKTQLELFALRLGLRLKL